MLDSRQFLAISRILYRTGIYSFDTRWMERDELRRFRPDTVFPGNEDETGRDPAPGYLMEPIVPLSATLVMKAVPSLADTPFSGLLRGDPARTIKMVNLFWAMILLSGTWSLSSCVFRPAGKRVGTAFSVAAVLGVFAFLMITDYMDRFLSEIPAMALLVWVSFFAFRLWQFRRGIDLALFGFAFGILSLIKALFSYLFFPVLFCILAGTYFSVIWSAKQRMALLFLPPVFFALVTAPWMARNYYAVGDFAIAERGGETLYFRALKNTVVNNEYGGSFYVWTPTEYRPLAGMLTGYSDRDMELGGRIAALNRERSSFTDTDYRAAVAGDVENTVSYYNKTYALKQRFRKETMFKNPGMPVGMVNALTDNHLKNLAKQMIRDNLTGHISATLPFFYRGIWGIAGLGRMGPIITLKQTTVPGNEERNEKTLFQAYLCLLFFCALLLSLPAVFLFGLMFCGSYAAMLLPSFALMSSLALLTHNLPRYNLPVFPLALVSALFCGSLILKSVFHKKESTN